MSIALLIAETSTKNNTKVSTADTLRTMTDDACHELISCKSHDGLPCRKLQRRTSDWSLEKHRAIRLGL